MSTPTFTHYCIVDNINACSALVTKLKDLGIEEVRIGVLSKDEDFSKADVPEVDLTDKSNVLDALQRGAFLGSGGGLLVGLALATFPVAGITVGGAAIASMVAGGAVAGAWSASMIGISEQSPLVQRFDQALIDNKSIVLFSRADDQVPDPRLDSLVVQISGGVEYGELL